MVETRDEQRWVYIWREGCCSDFEEMFSVAGPEFRKLADEAAA